MTASWTDTTDGDVLALGNALPAELRDRTRCTKTLAYNIGRAVREQHWTVEQLARECARDLADADNAGAVITERLRVAATVPPPKPKTSISRGRPFCSPECRDNAGWILDANHNPTSRCPCRTTEASA